MRASDDDQWVTLGGGSRLRSLIIVSPLIVILPLESGLIFSVILSRDGPLPWSILIMIGVAAAIVVFTMVIVRFVYPPASLNAGSATIRAGWHRSAYSEVTTAQLLASASKTRRNLNLLLKSDEGLRAVILIRDSKQRTLSPEAAALVCDLIRQANIALPRSETDPKGKFTRYNFPDNITREDALDLIEHPPAFHDPLPTAPRL